jgi:type VI protein secretion system component Hcp
MSGSNIFMQLITATGPVVGECLLDGYYGSIELKDFSWGMQALKDSKPAAGGGLGGGLANAAKGLIGMGDTVSIQLEPLSFTKRFDTASAKIHACLDQHVKVISASITVVHIRKGGLVPYQPGFVLLATNGFFAEADVQVQPDGNLVEVVETCTLNFQHITMTYLKTLNMMGLGENNVPTMPFTCGNLSL